MTLPNVAIAIKNWQIPITGIKVNQSIDQDTGKVKFNEVSYAFMGVVQPLSKEELEVKPEAQRSWQWLQIHTLNSIEFKNNDRILYSNTRFKIMNNLDYSIYGYYEYHIVEDYLQE